MNVNLKLDKRNKKFDFDLNVKMDGLMFDFIQFCKFIR